MQATYQKQEQKQQQLLNPKTLAEQREQITPQETDDWYDSSQSQNSLQESDNQKESKIGHTSNILGPFLSVSKDELSSNADNEQKIKNNEIIESHKISIEKIQKMKLQKQKEYKSFYHKLEQKISLLLAKMQGLRLLNLHQISGLKDNGTVELFNKNKQMIVKTVDKAAANEAINKISDFVDDLNVLRLQIRPQLMNKLQRFRKIRDQLTKRKIILFNFENVKQQRGLYIGGLVKVSELKKTQLQIRNYKIFAVKLRKYANRRTYKIILDNIFDSNMMKKAMMKFSFVNLLEVDKQNRNKQINVIMNIQSKIDIPSTEYEDFLVKNIRNFFVANFILSTQTYLPKLSVRQDAGIKFIYINERNNKRRKITYLLIIAETEAFFKFYKEIQNQIEKIGQLIFGIRFFNNLFPNFHLFTFDPAIYCVNRFPKINTYSMIVTAKQRQGKKYYWRQTFHMFVQMKKLMQKAASQQISFIQQDQI